MEVWFGECYLVKSEGRDKNPRYYDIQAAIYCASSEEFEHLLKAHIEPLGYDLILAEKVLPSINWLTQFGHNNILITLSQSVGEHQLVALSEFVDKNANAAFFSQGRYLSIAEYTVSPLSDANDPSLQDQEWITPDLKELLFKQPQDDQTLKSYFIVDATLRKNIVGHFDLDQLDVPVQCLFEGEAVKEFKEVAPYLIDMTLPADAWDNSDQVPRFHKDFFQHHWGQNTGIFIRTNADFQEVRQHFRKFTKVSTSGGKSVFFRFWVPTTCYPLLHFYKESKEYAHLLFRNIVKEIVFPHPQKPKVLSYQPISPILETKKFVIDDALKDHFTSYVRFTHVMRLWREAEQFLTEHEPALTEEVEKTLRSKRFSFVKKLYRLGIVDTVQAAAILSIIYRTGMDVLSEQAFDYATKNPFLPAKAKARQLIVSFVMIAKMNNEGDT